MKKFTALIIIIAATVAFAGAMVMPREPIKMSSGKELLDMKNILKVPVWKELDIDLGTPSNATKITQIEIPREMSEGAKCAALRVSHLIIHTEGKLILGALGSNVYPTIEEGVFAVTNEIVSAVLEISGGKATCRPAKLHKDKGYAETLFMWNPDPASTRELELIVRQYVSPKKQMGIACCLHSKGDGIRGEMVVPTEKK